MMRINVKSRAPSDILFKESLISYLIKIYGVFLFIIFIEVSVVFGLCLMEFDRYCFVFFIILGLFGLVLNIFMIIQMFTSIRKRMIITSSSIIEGNWNMSTVSELKFSDIEKIEIYGPSKKRLLGSIGGGNIVIYNTRYPKSMVFYFLFVEELFNVENILKETKLEVIYKEEMYRKS